MAVFSELGFRLLGVFDCRCLMYMLRESPVFMLGAKCSLFCVVSDMPMFTRLIFFLLLCACRNGGMEFLLRYSSVELLPPDFQ